jgi:hypothetical protein
MPMWGTGNEEREEKTSRDITSPPDMTRGVACFASAALSLSS